MNWEDVRFFLSVARTRSLSAAAEELGVSVSTTSRRIERLEVDLRETLFTRRHDGYRLTQAGASVMADAERVEAQISSLKRALDVGAEESGGVVRLATPELLAHEIILPALPAFRQANPGISLELMADVRPVALSRRTADVVIRAVRPRNGDFKIRKIGRVAAALFGSPAYLRERGYPKSTQDLNRHDLIAWDHALSFLAMSKWLTDLAGEHEPWLRTTNMTSQLLGCRAGLGLAVLPSLIGRNAGLVRVLPQVPPLELDLWLLVSIDLVQGKRVRRVIDFLSNLFSDPALLE